MEPLTKPDPKSRVRAALAVALVTAVVVGTYQLISDDEAPIRVRGGSMEIHAALTNDNEWAWSLEEDGDNVDSRASYSHEPDDSYTDRSKDLWVKVLRRTGTCASGDRATGKMVRVDYSDGFTATFKRGKSGWWNYRTKVRPRELTLDAGATPPVLRHGSAGVGHITRVRVNGGTDDTSTTDQWECTFNDANALDVIYICSSDDRQECQ